MRRSRIIVTSPQTNFVSSDDYEANFDLKFLDLRDKNYYEICKLLPSVLYNHLIAIKLDEEVTSHLNDNSIGFTEVYQKDDKECTDLSSELNYLNGKIYLQTADFNLEKYFQHLQRDLNNPFASGWNAHADYMRRNRVLITL